MSASAVALVHVKHPKTAISRIVGRRTVRAAAFWALAFGAVIASKAAGYASAYPTVAARDKLAASFGNNVGLNALLGAPHQINTVAGFTEWNIGPVVLIGSIWAFLLATKTLRGEEDAGRWEMLLAGQTTARRAAANALAGLGAALGVMYVIMAVAFAITGQVHTINYTAQAGFYFAMAAVAAPAMFMAVGALAAELMPTRGRASSLAAVIFGICFLLRALADTTSAHWLLNFTPLGWIEKLQPLYGSQPLWLLPIVALTGVLIGCTLWLADRDLGSSTVADRGSAKPRLMLLNSPLGMAFRLTRAASAGWLAIVSVVSLLFGSLAKSAGQAFASSVNTGRVFGRLEHAARTSFATQATKGFLGVAFFLVMLLIMSYVSSALGAIREDEADGYLDNLLVRPVARMQWLFGRIALIVAAIGLAGLVGGLMMWVGESSQHAGIAYSTLLPAGLNACGPALFVLGLGTFAFGFVPRLTTLVTYGVLAWSFLLNIISTGLHLNHWILDSSLFTHVSFAPAVNPKWSTFGTLVLIAAVLALLGAVRFRQRDLQTE